MTITEFIDKWKDKYNISCGHFSIENDWTLHIKGHNDYDDDPTIYLSKDNLDEFKELIKDYDDNRINWESTEICDCQVSGQQQRDLESLDASFNDLMDFLNEK